MLERRERQGVIVRARRKIQPADRPGERVEGFSFLEGEDRHARIAQQLRGQGCQQHRFTGACRAEDQGVPDIADMQIQAERRGAARHAVHERRRFGRVEIARRGFAARPDRALRQQVREIQGVDERTADVFVPVTGQRAEECIQGVDRLDAGDEPELVDALVDVTRSGFDLLAILGHQDDDRRVIADAHQPAAYFSQRGAGVIGHVDGVFVDSRGVRVKNLGKEAAYLLFPFSLIRREVVFRFLVVHEDETARPAVDAIHLRQLGEHSGAGFERQPFYRNGLDEFPADFGYRAGEHLLAPEQ